MKRWSAILVLAVVASAPCSLATAGSHTWRVNEVFSNADGTIQFIELSECCGNAGEIFVGTRWVRSDSGGSFQIPANLAGSTSNEKLLFGTAGYAAQAGVPAPDYIIADGFVDVAGDTVRYGVNPPASQYHSFTFGAGDLPTDCESSIQLTSWNPNSFTTGAATPEAYMDVAGSIDCSSAACAWDCDGSLDGAVNVSDLLALLGQYDPGAPTVCTGGSCDFDGNGCVDVADLLKLLGHYDPSGVGCP